jgi:alpha-ribazole phosphatase
MADKDSMEIDERLFRPGLKVFLIRHGETEGWKDKRLDGHTDSPLTENGKRQMQGVAERMVQVPLTAIYSSDLSRTRTGAEMLSEKTGLEVQIFPDLRELHFGDLENLPYTEGLKLTGDDIEQALNWVDNAFPGGESLLDMRDRVMPAYKKIVSENSGAVAIYSHGGTNRLILCEELGISLYNFFRIEQDHACINIIHIFQGNIPVVKLINGTASSTRF